MTWSQSVDEALCFGWIDGVRRSIDEVSYCIRFTPRKPSSIWSNINIAKVADLTKKDLMQPAGFEAFSKRKADKYEMYSFENDAKEFTPEFVKRFQSNPAAWDFFMKQAPASFRKTVIHWIVTAKQEKTRLTRLEKMIAECEQGIRGWEKYKK